MAAYMRNLFPFLGLPTPLRTILAKDALDGLRPSSEEDLLAAAARLWNLPEREYQYAACGLLSRHQKLLTERSLPALRTLVETSSWWDTVDSLAGVIGSVVRKNPQLSHEMDAWIDDSNFWVTRVAILHQLKWKTATDAERLFRYCEQRASDTEFFIRKAIGWALREYSKTDAAAVRSFVAAHEQTLSGLSKREGLLWLHGGRKGATRAANDA
jgi:3-methyladenine DNA glycosylase AlkD